MFDVVGVSLWLPIPKSFAKLSGLLPNVSSEFTFSISSPRPLSASTWMLVSAGLTTWEGLEAKLKLQETVWAPFKVRVFVPL